MSGPAPDRVLRAALASSRLPQQVAHATRGLLSGFWLGVLSDASLEALDERHHGSEDRYQADAWNEHGLFEWEAELVQRHVAAAGRIAVVAAGGGREVLALRILGYDAVGYESHPALAAYGERFLAERGHPGALHPAPRDGFPLGAGNFDAVIVGWGGYSLVHGAASRHALLTAARRLLAGHAPVLISYFERPSRHREARLTLAVANTLRRARRARALELGDTLSPNLVHMFDRSEIDAEAALAGLEVADHRVVEAIEPAVSYAAAVLTVRP